MTARFLNTFLYISVFCILHFKKLPFGSEQLSDLGKLQCSIEGVLIPGCPTISSTWQLLKTSLVMKSFLIHRQSHHKCLKFPDAPSIPNICSGMFLRDSIFCGADLSTNTGLIQSVIFHAAYVIYTLNLVLLSWKWNHLSLRKMHAFPQLLFLHVLEN